MDDDYNNDHSKDSNYYNGKIMFASGAVLVLACIIVVLFHAFVRRSRRRNTNNHPPPHHHQSGTRLRHVILISGVPEGGGGGGGLDLRVLKSIPTFTYESKTTQEKTMPPLECVVCLSEFEDGEMGRVLPGCSHRFHVGCIDVWLGTHSDCPLCRAEVRTDDRVNICIDGGDESGRDDPGWRIDQDRSSSPPSSSTPSSHDRRTVAVEQDDHQHDQMKTEGRVWMGTMLMC